VVAVVRDQKAAMAVVVTVQITQVAQMPRKTVGPIQVVVLVVVVTQQLPVVMAVQVLSSLRFPTPMLQTFLPV